MRSEPFGPRSASSRTPWSTVALVAGAILVVSVIPTSVLLHFLGYAALAATLAGALGSRRLRSAIGGSFVGASGYGVLMEVVQSGLPYRTFSTLDVAINASGALLATAATLVVAVLRRSE